MRNSRQGDYVFDDSLAQARAAYVQLLARLGLPDAGGRAGEPKRARSGQQADPLKQPALDIDFGAAIDRLESRRDLPREVAEKSLRQLLDAEYECDQAEWERDCHVAAWVCHSQFRATPRPIIKPIAEADEEAAD